MDYKKAILQFSMLLLLASLSVFVVGSSTSSRYGFFFLCRLFSIFYISGGVGYSEQYGDLVNVAWGKFKAPQPPFPAKNGTIADVYLGLRNMVNTNTLRIFKYTINHILI